jgi:membrane protein DedA with SNARE-associated domain
VPGETALLAGAIVAQRGKLDLTAVIAVAAVAAIAGDNLGYLFGRSAGRAVLDRYGHLVRLGPRRLRVMEIFYERHGPSTVFIGRWITLLRAAAALLAGCSHMSWWRFSLFNALGAFTWATTIGLLGYFFARSVSSIDSVIGIVGIALFVVVMVTVFLYSRRLERRLRAEVMAREGRGSRSSRQAKAETCRAC